MAFIMSNSNHWVSNKNNKRRYSSKMIHIATGDQQNRKITINVSGRRYDTYLETLNKYPDTLLGSEDREIYFNSKNNEYYFDRDPVIFRYILNYYRIGKLHFPRNECVSLFDNELKFFGIKFYNISMCCFDDYNDKTQDLNDRVAEYDKMKKHQEQNESLSKLQQTFKTRLNCWLEEPQNSWIGKIIYYITGIFITLSVCGTIIETIKCKQNVRCGKLYDKVFFYIEATCGVVFTIEYTARLYAARNRLKHGRSILSIIDIVAILPFYIGLVITKTSIGSLFMALRVFRVFRIFKFSRHSKGLRILGSTFLACAKELSFLLFSLSISMIIFSTLMFYVEKEVEGSEFSSIPASFWYTVVTMTTLGYGDMVPQTTLGRIIGGVCSLSGVIVISLPVPVIVSNFSRIYLQSQRTEKLKNNESLRNKCQEQKQSEEEGIDNCSFQDEKSTTNQAKNNQKGRKDSYMHGESKNSINQPPLTTLTPQFTIEEVQTNTFKDLSNDGTLSYFNLQPVYSPIIPSRLFQPSLHVVASHITPHNQKNDISKAIFANPRKFRKGSRSKSLGNIFS